MADFLFQLDSTEKIDCPECGHNNCFVRYINTSTGKYLDEKYGRCDRENNCGYHLKPDKNRPLKTSMNEEEKAESIFDCDFIPDFMIDDMHRNDYKQPNTLLRGLTDLFGKEKVMRVHKLYRLGTWMDGAMVFPYISTGLHTAKIMWYDESLHRIKDGKKGYIQWLHNCNYTADNGRDYGLYFDGRHTLPLFGHHLLFDKNNTEKIVGIVESEKTAIIMAMLFPEFVWLATGGLRNVQKHKFYFFQNKKVLFLSDMGIVRDENLSVRDLWNQKIMEILSCVDIRYGFVNYIPYNMPTTIREKWEDDGKDVSDFIFEYNPEWFNDEYGSYIEYLNRMVEEAKKKL